MRATDPNCYLSTSPAAVLSRRVATERFVVPQLWALSLLVFGIGYVLLFCNAIPTFIDEGYSFNLATDKSLTHMLSALRDGADGSFPLYALSVYGWEKVFGPSELSLRLNSGLFVFLFIWHSSRRLERLFGPAIAVLSVLFVLADETFTHCALEARFYGLLLFLFSLCFWSAWDLVQERAVSHERRFRHALFCGLLCLCHPLGLVYAAILALLYVAFAYRAKNFSIASTAAFLGGPALFLLWLPSFLIQRLVNPTYTSDLSIPGWSKYWRFAFFGNTPLVQVLLGGIVVFICMRWLMKQDNASAASGRHLNAIEDNDPTNKAANTLLILYSLAFILCLNVAIGLFDGARVIPIYWMFAVRYVLVCWVPYAVVVAAIFKGSGSLLARVRYSHWRGLAQPIAFALIVAGLLAEMESHWHLWFKDRASDTTWLQETWVVAREKHMDVVCGSHCDAFHLATRTPTRQIKYLLPETFPYKHLMLQMAKHYPHPAPISATELVQCTNQYLFVATGKKASIVKPQMQ